MTDTTTLAERLTDSATTQGQKAAIWLLDQTGWLPRLEPKHIAREYTDPDDLDDFSLTMYVQYGMALSDIPGSPAERQILRIAGALAHEELAHLDDLSSLDENNRRLTLHAIAWAAGGRQWAESLQLIPAPCPCGAEPVHQAGCSGGEA